MTFEKSGVKPLSFHLELKCLNCN